MISIIVSGPAAFLIYPGKLSRANCFRIRTIGRINAENVRDLVAAIDRLLRPG